MADDLMAIVSLPFVTASLPGFGGRIKAEPDHFVVEEVPLYEASGEGNHLYVSLTRTGSTTRQVVEALAQHFGLRARDIGYAGLKDRHARCTQVFSLPGVDPLAISEAGASLPFEIHWARHHRHKLKVGHLLGNRFQITITDLAIPGPEALARARAVADLIASRGLPNFFGAQRFGIDGGNVDRGRETLKGGGPRDRWLRKLLISAYQSHLFNAYLVRRLELGLFDQLLDGDIAKKADTGGMFEVTEAAVEQPRYQRGEIHFTGPIFGSKMWEATGQAGALEGEVLQGSGLSRTDFGKARTRGSRRAARLWLPTIDLKAGDASLVLSFFLPKGAYATIVAREFTRNDEGLSPLGEGPSTPGDEEESHE